MSNPDLSEEQKEVVERERKKFKEESGREVVVRVESETAFEQQKVWDSMRQTLKDEYEKRSLVFDADSIKTKEQLESEFAKLQKMKHDEDQIDALSKNQRDDIGERGLEGNYASQEKQKPTRERSTEYLKRLASDLGDISLVEFTSEKEMLKFLEDASHDSNFENQKQAEKLYAQVLAHTLERNQSIEYTGLGKDFGKKEGKWKKKHSGEID
ncbi:hypothetical protein MUP01_13990 [Candidatus Bathyarchaeota archaeon]|nr:hypothetical protein [Candidatus Bathyarchaeota archaeon]